MEKKFLSFEELHQYTGFSKSYLYKLTAQGVIPNSKPGGKVMRFLITDADSWLLSNKSTAPAEIETETDKYLSTLKTKCQ